MKRMTGRVPDIFPERTVAQLLSSAKFEWMNQPEQVAAIAHLKTLGWNGDRRTRTMASRWRTVQKDKYGGVLWFQVLLSTGTIPSRMLTLANTQLAQRQQPSAPASSWGPALQRAAPTGAPTGSQHKMSGQKRDRGWARKLTNRVGQEEERRLYATGQLDDKNFAQPQAQADWATKRASEASRASGYSYRLNGETHGAPETSNFAILLADFCALHDIDVSTGFPHRRR